MRKNLRLYLTFIFILLIAAFSIYIDLPQGSKISLPKIGIAKREFKPHLGLDLQGGTHLEYQGNLQDIPADKRKDAMESVRSAIERRVFFFGVQEPLVETSGSDRIIVELPGITDINQAVSVIGQTPFLEFKEQNPSPTGQVVDGKVVIDPNSQWKSTGLTGKDLSSATVEFSQQDNTPQISLQFNSEGTKLFGEITSRNLGKPVAIFLDGAPLSTPTVQSAITDGKAIITGQFTVDDAKQLVSRLNSGALPVPIKLISQQNVGASLGKDSIQKSAVAGIIGLLLIVIFMIIYYRLPGVLAVLALVVYALLSFAIYKIGISVTAVFLVGLFFVLALTSSWWFGVIAVLSYLGLMLAGGLHPVTLTLAGIAGFILSIGMAVDANILIFERTKEELRLGKDVPQALEDGFNRAWLSIRDSNASSLITTAILYMFGTPAIKSFAETLAIGIIISLFTAITVTKTFLRMFIGHNILAHPWLFGASREKKTELTTTEEL
ncbi:MAG: protein-export rane protein SecD, preprotein translocase subunit SecD [Candidatus Doudnabacteria bacterium]|nr:protein-export rane protein SecD, preprotein translocase subunit SecD [Candidatus Doudnabacteria bacterium]